VQFYDASGARHEAVGFLERAEVRDGAPILHIRKKDDTLVIVPLQRIRAGRVIT
jgi:hypothetical protein